MPADVGAATRSSPQPHAPRRQDRNAEDTVVEIDDVDPLRQSAAESPFANRPVGRTGKSQVGRVAQLERINPNTLCDVGEDDGFRRHTRVLFGGSGAVRPATHDWRAKTLL